MSISLIGVMVGLPVALAMRGIMGKEKFEQWLEASDSIMYTDFSDMDEMRDAVQAAGYDVTEWMGLCKTHLTGQKSSYFLWEKREGQIIAKMSVYDKKEDIDRFVAKVEERAGRKVFREEGQTGKAGVLQATEKNAADRRMPEKRDGTRQEAAGREKKQERPKYRETFPSVYVDAELVLKLLKQYQIKVLSFQENQIEAEYECYQMSFSRSRAEDPFDIHVTSDSNKMKALYHCLDGINEEYYASVQEKAYLYIREQLEEEGLEIEEEEVMEDNSIVITVAV